MSLISCTPYVNADQGTLGECQRIKDRIEHYTNLKRAGGSAKQMASWHKKRNDYKAKYSSNRCSKHRKELK
jgi:hypothetical protein